MNILVSGAGGMVGTAVQQVLKDYNLICPKLHELNIANRDQVMEYAKKDISGIVHLACETDHEYCEANPSNCYFVNTIGTQNMVDLAKKIGCSIIYVSTASVFDGKKGEPYEPNDKPNPINHYNRSKYCAELMVKAYSQHFILRAGWMFGGGADVDKKFVNKIIKKIRRGDNRIKVADDCIGSPTYALDLADGIKIAIQDLEADYGIYHCVNECGEGVTRYEFAREIVKLMDADVEIVPCSIDELTDEFPCKRTNYEVLASDVKLRDWRSALKGYIYAHYRH